MLHTRPHEKSKRTKCQARRDDGIKAWKQDRTRVVRARVRLRELAWWINKQDGEANRVNFKLSCKERHESCGRSKGIFACFSAAALPLVSQGRAVNWRELPAEVCNRRIMRPIMPHPKVPSQLNSFSIVRINKIGPLFDSAYR